MLYCYILFDCRLSFKTLGWCAVFLTWKAGAVAPVIYGAPYGGVGGCCYKSLNKDPDARIILPELGRGAAILPAENPVEIGEVVKAALEGNFGDRLGSVDQQAGCVPQPDLVKAVDKGFAGPFFNKAAKGYFGHVDYPGDIGQGDVLFIMCLHKLKGLFDTAAGMAQVLIGKGSIGKRFNVARKGEVLQKRHQLQHGVETVFGREMLQSAFKIPGSVFRKDNPA